MSAAEGSQDYFDCKLMCPLGGARASCSFGSAGGHLGARQVRDLLAWGFWRLRLAHNTLALMFVLQALANVVVSVA